jgi:hypothetical protein
VWPDALAAASRRGVCEEIEVDESARFEIVWIPAFAGMTELFDFALEFVAPAKAGVHF